jgi:hypothetical protein
MAGLHLAVTTRYSHHYLGNLGIVASTLDSDWRLASFYFYLVTGTFHTVSAVTELLGE